MATAKHKVQKFDFNAANQKLVIFPGELQKLPAKNAFGIAAHTIIEQLIYAELPPHLKKSINQAHLENGTYEQIVAHLEKELQLNSLEGPAELQINTVSHNSANPNTDRPKPTCHHCKEPRHYKNQCRLLKRQTNSLKRLKIILETKTVAPITLSQKNNTNINNNNYKNSDRAEGKPETVYPPYETCIKTNHSTEKCCYEINAANRHPLGTKDRKNKIRPKGEPAKMTQMKLFRLQPKI